MSVRHYAWLLMFFVLVSAGKAEAVEERRIALIIGNDSYKSLKRLDNGANDARAMATELKAAGFETTLKVNAGRKEMHTAISEFGGKLASGSVGLFYYAGHGIQSGDKNFLIPIDADLQSEDDLDADAIDAGKVMRAMEAAHNRLNIVILDACRDNPLPKAGRSGARGLAVMAAPTGTFVAYATSPGKKAEDGDRNSNGVYTGELVRALREPGLKIEDVFKKAATGVMAKTGGKQVPWTQASIQGDFYFRQPEAPSAAPNTIGGADKETLFWTTVKDSQKAADFEDYLAQFPNGTFASLAKRRMEALKGARVASLSPPSMPKPEPVLDALDREMVVARKVKGREAPDSKSNVVSSLAEGDVVQVLGKVQGANWYLASRKGQSQGYVTVDSVEDPTTYKARKERETQKAAAAAAAPKQASLPNPAPIGVGGGIGTVVDVFPQIKGMVFTLRRGNFVTLNETVVVTIQGQQRRFRILSKDGDRISTSALDAVLPSIGSSVLSLD